jgi:hypothetical protein
MREDSLDNSCICFIEIWRMEPVVGVDGFGTSTGFCMEENGRAWKRMK